MYVFFSSKPLSAISPNWWGWWWDLFAGNSCLPNVPWCELWDWDKNGSKSSYTVALVSPGACVISYLCTWQQQRPSIAHIALVGSRWHATVLGWPHCQSTLQGWHRRNNFHSSCHWAPRCHHCCLSKEKPYIEEVLETPIPSTGCDVEGVLMGRTTSLRCRGDLWPHFIWDLPDLLGRVKGRRSAILT